MVIVVVVSLVKVHGMRSWGFWSVLLYISYSYELCRLARQVGGISNLATERIFVAATAKGFI